MRDNNSPYSTGAITSAPSLDMDVSNQVRQNMEDERGQKAPQSYPFTISAAESMLGDAFVNLANIKKIFIKTLTEPNVNKAAVNEVIRLIDSVGQTILIDIPAQVDKLKN